MWLCLCDEIQRWMRRLLMVSTSLYPTKPMDDWTFSKMNDLTRTLNACSHACTELCFQYSQKRNSFAVNPWAWTCKPGSVLEIAKLLTGVGISPKRDTVRQIGFSSFSPFSSLVSPETTSLLPLPYCICVLRRILQNSAIICRESAKTRSFTKPGQIFGSSLFVRLHLQRFALVLQVYRLRENWC